MLLLPPQHSRLGISAQTRGYKHRQTALKAKAAVTRLRGGMARRRGGSFNSILPGRKSPLARQSSEQQRARGGKTYEAEKHTIIHVSALTFLVPGCRTAPGCLCLWGTLFCVGGRPPSRSFFRYFICQIIAAATLSHSNRTVAQPSVVRGEKGWGYSWLMLLLANERTTFALRSAL